MCADSYGVKFAAGNAGTLYTAKGTASLLVPLASVLSAGANWDRAFIFAASSTIAAAIIAKFVLLPMRRKFIESANADADISHRKGRKARRLGASGVRPVGSDPGLAASAPAASSTRAGHKWP